MDVFFFFERVPEHASLDVLKNRSALRLLQPLRFLPSKRGCKREERVVMGDVYRQY